MDLRFKGEEKRVRSSFVDNLGHPVSAASRRARARTFERARARARAILSKAGSPESTDAREAG